MRSYTAKGVGMFQFILFHLLKFKIHAITAAKIREALAAARQDVFKAADLGRCQDGDATTSIDLDIAVLQARYDQILRDFGLKVAGFLTEAQTAFDTLVRNAPQKPPKQGSQ